MYIVDESIQIAIITIYIKNHKNDLYQQVTPTTNPSLKNVKIKDFWFKIPFLTMLLNSNETKEVLS